MRKLAVLTSALLILAACSAVPAEELTPAYPTASNVQNTSGPETLTYQIETHTWEDSVRTEDGTMLAWYRFHLPEMSVLQADGTPLETGIHRRNRRRWRPRRCSIPGFPAGSHRKNLRA